MKEGQQEQRRSLAERITNGSITAEELKKSTLGEVEMDAIKGYVKWLIDKEHYRLKDEDKGLEQGSDSLLEHVKAGAKKQLELNKWSTVDGIDWDKLVDEQAYS